MTSEIVRYWNNYYRHALSQLDETTFARFVMQNFTQHDKVIDIGCGDGRDTFFFARQGLKVMGVDASFQAIKRCRAKVVEKGGTGPRFYAIRLSNSNLLKHLIDAQRCGFASTILYARFLLHAITPEEQRLLLRHASALLRGTDRLCLEFRTSDDEGQFKEIGTHYRRFIRPDDVLAICKSLGLRLDYFVEGRGLAPFRSEDPVVARMVFLGKA